MGRLIWESVIDSRDKYSAAAIITIAMSVYPRRRIVAAAPMNNIATTGFETNPSSGERTEGISNNTDTAIRPRAILESCFISYYLNTENEIYTKRV
jgi:hypothetical protein